ncbi:hypothetical protein EKO04_011314 [Ascochyta lentis]|uniref:Peptidase A1 domain-containing protein n=1 Tax=Ascochyta lentis TaxID=205686 RepID=A0A8H7MF07_9PLEO|nr:hypothetical protein EKO04_011314 [Ascochyta lentis]
MSTPSPLVFSPSQHWQGHDGNWSSFVVRVGTPEQNFRVLPSPATGEVILPDFRGCQPSTGDRYKCAELRGVFDTNGLLGFQSNVSETWQDIGIFGADLEEYLGYTANASYGHDNVGLMMQNSGGPTLTNQVVGSLKKRPFFVGFFGLSPNPSNFSNFNDPQRSYLATLKDEQHIPSLAYGYSAESPKVFGSLTLGGYDEKRLIPNTVTFPFDKYDEQPARVKLQQVTTKNTLNGSVTILHDQIDINIDFTMPYLWLPPDTCDTIATHFSLTHDNASGLYLVDDATHNELMARNPVLTFVFGDGATSAETVSIVVPYAAFDLQASWPLFNDTKNYFPIRRGNSSQLSLGRAFMQEAYVVVDFERGNLSLHQAAFPAGNEQMIVPILADVVSSERGIHGLRRSDIAGIATGSAVLVALVVVLSLLLYFRRKRSHVEEQPKLEQWSSSENTHATAELAENKVVRMQLMSTEVLELRGSAIGEAGGRARSELE